MQPSKPFTRPQLQSPVGILLIFVASAFKSLRGLWVLGAYILFGKITGDKLFYLLFGAVLLAIWLIIYSILAYRRFIFHIDYNKAEFILKQGVFSTTEIAIPFDKIQQVYFKRDLLQRVINVYEVVIDTAGSKAEEVKIKALSRANADLLQAALLKEVQSAPVEESPDFDKKNEATAQPLPKELWTYRLSFGKLLRIGLSTNYLRGVWILLIFAGSILQQFDTNLIDEDYNLQLENLYDTYISTNYTLTLLFIALPILFLVGILITTTEVFIKYYGLKLTRTGKELQLEMGLKTNTRVALKPERIQIFTIKVNPVQRYLNLYNLQFSLVNSVEESEKSKIKVPGIPEEIVSKIQNFVFEIDPGATKESFRPNKLLFVRQCFFGLLPLMIGLLLWYIFLENFAFNFILPVFLIYLPAMIYLKWFSYKAIKLEFTSEFLIKKTGLWTKKTEIIPFYKLQSISVKQPLWYKKRNVYNLVFHTASGDVSFMAVNGAVLSQVNYGLYKIETAAKPWM
ncbi:PH domain-containing protein [Flavimarina sp. Hel_I_48]|uniref:PH domain-containing protein n=1 Tax=Flavimarina sp. Hel_I_48 TaxID=1392488 RepID=UPI0004DF667C|nr:PH domain-containing protein [Flavimarina sp. Hel_I_48]